MLRENKRLDFVDVKQICIQNNYYTGGTIEERENLAKLVARADRLNCPDELIDKIVEDIFYHSNCSFTVCSLEKSRDAYETIANQICDVIFRSYTTRDNSHYILRAKWINYENAFILFHEATNELIAYAKTKTEVCEIAQGMGFKDCVIIDY